MWRSGPAALLALALAWSVGGCANTVQTVQEFRTVPTVEAAQAAYDRGDSAQAYDTASRLAQAGGRRSDEAAYLAGMAAQRMGSLNNAARHFQIAARSTNQALSADALASLGLIYDRQGRYQLAAQTLLSAAEKLHGQDRAQAYFHAAVAQQRIGQWPAARTSLALAQSHSRDEAFRQQVQQQLDVTGYTIQLGAFADAGNAAVAAQRVAAQAAELGIGDPVLVPAQRNGQSLTLVQVGRFHSFYTAEVFRTRLVGQEAIVAPLTTQTTRAAR
jgi:tetratricopeptide (TPR) repeat protein